MASGKTRIGQLLAKNLGWPLYDLDQMIEEQEKQSIKDIFTEKGEFHFRQIELLAIKKLQGLKNSIIVPGGGAFTHFESLSALKTLGEIFYLDANFNIILRRLKKSSKRPLGSINTKEEIEKLKALYLFRRPIYQNNAHIIDVNHENKEKTCSTIINQFEAIKFSQTLPQIIINDGNNKYPIFTQNNIIEKANTIIASLNLSHLKPIIVTSDHLQEKLSTPILDLANSLKTPILTIADGEEHKNWASVEKIHQDLFQKGFNRQSMVLAIGGGNVGDVAGFAAATFMRGIPIVQIPTTLLAMVDSSVGGKTGVDNALGKNLIGSFHHPQAVIIDPQFLHSLPKDEHACGMAEVIKHAILQDRAFFSALLQQELEPEKIIAKAVQIKANIVFSDPQEKNIRAHLNLGHTFAHAIEKVSSYKVKHGMAVAMGLSLACDLSAHLGLLEEDFRADLKKLLQKYALPTSMQKNLDPHKLVEAMALDKKADQKGIKFILPKAIENISSTYVDLAFVKAFLVNKL